MCILLASAMGIAATAVADELESPPLGLFDYLGSMVEQDGELIDPLFMQGSTDDEQGTEGESEARDGENAAEELQ